MTTPLAEFFASGVLLLGARPGPFLWQLPGTARLDSRVMEDFLGRQPGDAARITGRKPPRRKQRDAHVYLDNDRQAHAPADALHLAGMVGASGAAGERRSE